ncbi:MAG: hypothetical protein M3Q70_03075 [bacterium]|nr:hypothetical protein [bacterium]
MQDNKLFLINPRTEFAMDMLVANPPHALMIHGRQGSGKVKLARILLRRINPQMDIQVFEALEGKSLGIDLIREIRTYMQIKTSSNLPFRAAIITPADTMTEEAQNALLKVLEEPASGSMILLLARNPASLLPTIISRVNVLNALPVELKAAISHYSEYDLETVTKYYRVSSGAPELLQTLLMNLDDPILDSIAKAKTFLTSTRFERLKQVEEHKAVAETLIFNLLNLVKATLQNPRLDEKNRLRFIQLFKVLSESEKRLKDNVSKKAVLLEVALAI